MKLIRKVGFLTLALAGLLAPLLASQVRADNKMKDKGTAAVAVNSCTSDGSAVISTSGGGNNFNLVQFGDVVTGPGIPAGITVVSGNPISGTMVNVSGTIAVAAARTLTFTGTRISCTMRFNIEGIPNPLTQPFPPGGPPCGPYDEIVGPSNGYQVAHFCVGQFNPADNKAVGKANYDVATGISTNPVWLFGDAKLGGESPGGGNQIQTLPDSLAAGVGLYQAGGGTNLGSNPDSLLRMQVTRSGTQVTLSYPTIMVGGVPVGVGGMQTVSLS